MRDVAIVSTARTGLAKSVRGSFNATHPITLAGAVLGQAIARAGIAPDREKAVLAAWHAKQGA